MKLMGDGDRRFANLEKKIGLFVVLAVSGMVLLMVVISMRQEVFVSRANIFFVADSGSDLDEGQAVKFKGFRIGKVRKVRLDEEAKVVVTLSIDEDYMRWIKTDSKARLRQEGVIGDNIIEITGGSEGAPRLEEDGFLPFEREKGINQLFEDLKGEIELTLIDIKQIISYVNDPEGDIKQFLANANKLAGELRETRRNLDGFIAGTGENLAATLEGVDSVVASIQNTVMPELDSALRSAGSAAAGTESAVTRLDERLPGLINSVSRSLENMERITEDIKRASPGVPAVVEGGGELVEGASEVVDSLKGMWPISKGIKEPRERAVGVDSYE